MWDYYVDMFAEGGMEIYETMGMVHVAEEATVGDGGKVRSVLKLRDRRTTSPSTSRCTRDSRWETRSLGE